MAVMLRFGGSLLVCLIMVSTVSATPLVVDSYIGDWNAFGWGGAIGFVNHEADANPGSGQFGMELQSQSLVNSLSFTPYNDPTRYLPENVRVYVSPTESYDFTLADDWSTKTITFPTPVETSYLNIEVNSKYTHGTDQNWGVQNISVDGTPLYREVNLNAGGVVSTVGSLLPANFPPYRAADGLSYSSGTGTSTYLIRNAGQDSMTVTYSTPRTVTSIGLGVETNGGGRDIPKFVTVEDSNGGSQQVTLTPSAQYGRYDLATPIEDTSFLKLTFPDGDTAADWQVHGDSNYGITEFQAFGGMRVAQIADPVITDAATPYNNTAWVANNLLDNNTGSGYASASMAADTYVDFDFGEVTRISAFEYQQRGAAVDFANKAQLIFSNDPDFSTVLATIDLDNARAYQPNLYGFAEQNARYVRWDVTEAGGPNPGGKEAGFFATIPEKHERLDAPTVIDHASEYNSVYEAENMFDGDLSTEYAADGEGVGTFVELDYGAPTFFTGVEYLDRPGTRDWTGSFSLTFSSDDDFTDPTDTTLVFDSYSAAYETFSPIQAQFVRWEVLSLATPLSGTHVRNVGGRELYLHAAVPEPSTFVLSALGLIGLIFFSRKRSSRK